MSKVDKNAPITSMEKDIDPARKSLRPLFPHISDEELHKVEDCFYGYLEIAWRIFERLEAEGYFEKQVKPTPPEFESPQESALFEKNENKKRMIYLRFLPWFEKMLVVVLIIKNWNQIVEHLKAWRQFAIDLAASNSPQKDEAEYVPEELIYEPIKPHDGWQRPQVLY